VDGARGDADVRAMVEASLPGLEAKGWHISHAVHQIWAGERDWHALTEGLSQKDSLLVLLVLEALARQ
jgi:hypothetical protein